MREAFTISDARPADALALAAIEQASPEQGRHPMRVMPVQDYFAIDRATPGMRALVARDLDGNPIGTVSYRVSASQLADGTAAVAYHSRLRVHPSYRRRGLATALLVEACQRASADGAALSWGAILAGNVGALAACRAAGYFVVGELEARAYPVCVNSALPSAARHAGRLQSEMAGVTWRGGGQLADIGPAFPDVRAWSLVDHRTLQPSCGIRTRDLSPYWRIAPAGGSPAVRLAWSFLSSCQALPPVDEGLRLTIAGGGWPLHLSGHATRDLVLALCHRLRRACDALVIVTDPRTDFARGLRTIPSLRSHLWLVAQPPGLLDPSQPFDAFAL